MVQFNLELTVHVDCNDCIIIYTPIWHVLSSFNLQKHRRLLIIDTIEKLSRALNTSSSI